MPPPADRKQPHTEDADADAQNKLLLWLVAAMVVLAIAALVIWLYSLYRDSTEIALSLPPPRSQAHRTAQLPPPIPPASKAIEPAIVPVEPVAPAAPLPAGRQKPAPKATATAHLSEAQIKQLAARMQNQPLPASCESAITALRQRTHVSPAQARELAERAYPQLCAPAAAPAPAPASPPPAPHKPNRTINQVFQERSASECAAGLQGLFCRERLRYRLCEGQWSVNPPAGKSICQQLDNSSND